MAGTATTLPRPIARRAYLASPLARAATKTDSGSLTEVAGLAVPYNTPTDLGGITEIVKPGAFTASIQAASNGIPLLLLHDSHSIDAVLGRAMAADFTEKRDGLHVRFTLNSSTAAQDAARLARDGGLGYLSIGFQYVNAVETVDRKSGRVTVELHEGRLLEVSLVSTPAYSSAAVSGVRSAAPITPDEIAAAALNLAAGNYDTAANLAGICLDPDLTPAQQHATAQLLTRCAPHGPIHARHAIDQAAAEPHPAVPLTTLAQLYRALPTNGTTSQNAASYLALRHAYGLPPQHTSAARLARRDRRRR